MLTHIARSSWFRAGIAIALLAAMLWFASRSLADGASSIGSGALLEDAEWFVLAIGLFMLGTLFLGATWIVLIENVAPGEAHRRGRLMLAFSYSWLGRYVPGTLPFFASKVYLGARLGYGTRPLIITTAVQNVLEIFIATTLGATMIIAAQGLTAGSGRYIALALLPSLALTALHPSALRRIVNASLRVVRRDPLPDGELPSPQALVAASLCVAANQVANGVAFWVILYAIGNASVDDVFLATGALSLAGVAGMLVVLVPAGLGVRDGTLTALTAARFTVEVAAVAAITLRLLTVIADLLLFGLAFVIDVITGTRVAWHAVRSTPDLQAIAPPSPSTSTGAAAAAATAISERRSA